MNYLAPSLLAADFSRLDDEIRLVDLAGAEYIHFDVMDGVFVPEISFGLPIIRSARGISEKIFDVHLMIEHPERCIDDYAAAGADIITVHAEACTHLDRVLTRTKELGVRAGVALNPSTPLNVLDYCLPLCDMVLLMSVNPGYGGQKFIPYVLDKVRDLRSMLKRRCMNTDIEVDGGVTLENIAQILHAGANVIVSGSAVFCGDTEKNVKDFLTLMTAV